jgi:DNA invertase Pin-like site-specific DNA recombinase
MEPSVGPVRGPAPGSTVLIGYARGAGDAPDEFRRRLALLEDAGCGRIVGDESAGKDAGQPKLRDCLESLRPDDVLMVTSLDQLGRTQRELTDVVGELRRRGAGLRSVREDLDTTAPGGEAIFRVFAGLADLSRATLSAGTSEGMAAARARGKRLGRPPALTPEQLREVRELLLRPESTVSGIARRMGVSRSTLYKYLPDARPTDAPGRGRDDKPSPGAAAHLAPHQVRPGRRALVIDDLADLHGPVAGNVELPLRLFWSLPGHHFDLGVPDMRRWYYQTVLREASRAPDLTDYLDAATLVSLWPQLDLPKGVRRAWEDAHESLRAGVNG